MIATSSQFKLAIKQPGRKITARLVFGDTLYDDRYIQKVTLDTTFCPDDFQIGIAPMSIARVEMEEDAWDGLYIPSDLTGQECSLDLGIRLPDGSTEFVSMGVYTVETFERDKTYAKLKLVDNMHKAEIPYDPTKNISTIGIPHWMMESYTFEELELNTYDELEQTEYQIMAPPVYPATIYDIAKHAALQSGIALDTAAWPNSTYVVSSQPVFEGMSCRQILAQVAELAGGFAVINRLGNFEIKTFDNVVRTQLTDEDLYSYKEHKGNTGMVQKVIVKVGDEQASLGDGDNLYTIVDNIFVQNPSNVVSELYASLQGVNYIPIESVEWSGDFSLDPCDKVDINANETYILNRSISVTGGLSETISAPIKSNVERRSTGKNNTQLDINQLKTTIKVIAGEITQVIENGATKSELTQVADNVTLKFSKAGGRNLIKNGLFKNGIGDITFYHKTAGVSDIRVDTNEYTGNVPALTIVNDTSGAETTYFMLVSGLTIGKKYTFGCLGAGHRAVNSLIAVNSGDNTVLATSNEAVGKLGGSDISGWEELKMTLTAAESQIRLRFHSHATDVNGIFWVRELRCFEGDELLPYDQHPDESFGASHVFTEQGYMFKDSNGAEMFSLSKGMANEQNFGSTQNVEDGYPLRMSFKIGDTTSLITAVELKLKQYNFRTDSKGARSGGGTTSSSSGPPAFYTNTQTQLSYPNESQHYHLIPASQLAHTHTIYAHTHLVEFGIEETPNGNGTIEVYIDGVYRTVTYNTDITLDITQWVTTNGVHELELRSPNLKRIQADLFIRSYIRR